MPILIAKSAGFCEGVERAFKIALQTTRKEANLYMLGNLVHNTKVVEKLKQTGIKVVERLVEIPKDTAGTLLISAHGVSPQIIKKAKALKLRVIDTTCAWVKKAQKIAYQLSQQGYFVVIIGDLGHPEVKGLKSWAGIKSKVISSKKQAQTFPQKSKIGIISQTTQSEQNFKEIVNLLKPKAREIKIHNTICGATAKRQNAALEIAQKVDLMLVIGDKKSANTKRLAELCKNECSATYQIQTARELKHNWLTNITKIGVTAGASTPAWIIKEVLDKLGHEK